MQIVFNPIGVVSNKAGEGAVRDAGKDSAAEIEIYPEFEDALEGIEGFSHLFVLCYFNRLRPEQVGPLKVKPRRMLKKGYTLDELPTIGVFALDSPTRPNPIGLTLVRLLRREVRRLAGAGLDFFDGTPVLDIKGYRAAYRAEDFSLPEWYAKLLNGPARP